MVDNLIIGASSQLAYYLPSEFIRISSREIDFDFLNRKWDKVFLLFAEQRTFKEESNFVDINFELTVRVLDILGTNSNKIFLFSTSELWNMYDGPVNVDLPYKYSSTPYIESKRLLCEYINSDREKYHNVVIIYPFNFNSVYRKQGFLFYKIYDSILNKNFYELGNVDFYRDILHASTVVDRTLHAEKDTIIGAGVLINVKKFIEDIYYSLNLDIHKFLRFDNRDYLSNKRKDYYNHQLICSYEETLELTVREIKEKMNLMQ